MNSAEKKILHTALVLFVVGVVVRVLPWGVPAIDQVDVSSKMEYTPQKVVFVPDTLADTALVTDKVTYADKGAEPRKKSKKRKKKQNLVRLPVHANSASQDELCALKGVGPKLADKIIAFRDAHGPFKNGADLEKVPGIGKKKAEGILLGVIFD